MSKFESFKIIIPYLTLFGNGFFGAAHGWGAAKKVPSP